jgi:hypothetical protein
MKVLCKKDYYGFGGEKLFWTRGNIYSFEDTGYLFKLESNFTPHVVDKKISAFYKKMPEFFYTPEETINVLRIKLIDKILNDN